MATSFADTLDPLAPPPPPQMRFTDVLAAGFGAGPDRIGAYQKGLDSGSQYRLRSAQTESALEEAEKRRQEAMAESMANDLRRKAAANPSYVPTISELLPLATGANDFASARNNYQENTFRQTLGDPNAAPAAQFAAGQGVKGQVLPQVEALGPGREINMLTQQPSTNPIGAAQIANYQEPNSAGAAGAATGAPLIRSSPIGPVQSTDGGRTWTPVLQNRDVADFNAARTAGAATGPKQAALPAALNNLQAFEGTVDDLLKHPGFNAIYGLSSWNPFNAVPGADAQGASALRDQLNSRAFLASIQQMRGMGQLSNQEGAKVETALTAALKPGLGDEEAVRLLGELKLAITNLKNVATQEANATENVLTGPGGAQPRSFPNEAAATTAGVRPGERVIIGGVAGTWE